VNFSWLTKITSLVKYWLKKLFYRKKAEDINQVANLEAYDQNLVLRFSPSRLPGWQQLKYLPRFLNNKEKKQAWFLLSTSIIALLILAFSIAWRQTVVIAKVGGSYTEALIGTPQYINPIFGTSDVDTDISKLIYAGLLRYNEQLELVNDLAENYEISPDGKTYTFTLKQNLHWHDGQEITAKDIAFTMTMIQDIRNNSPLEPSFRGVKINQLDDFKIQFILEKPFAPFLHSLTVGILPAHAWENISTTSYKLAELNLKPIGAGPWKFAGLKKNKDGNLISYALVPFADYYGQKPYLKNLNFKFYPNYDSAWQSFQEQNVDGISYITKEKKSLLAKNKMAVVYELQLPQYTAIFINEANNEVLREIKIRLALELAIDKNKILAEVFGENAKPLLGPLLPGIPGYNPELNPNPFNQDQAKQILTELGWQTKEGEQFLSKEDKILQFTITTVNFVDNTKIANIIKQQWEEIGIKTNINIVSASSIQREIIRPRQYELLLFGEILGSDPDYFPFWHSSQLKDPGFNLTSFNNKRADALLEKSRATMDSIEREELLKQFENIILEYKPAIFLFQPTYSYLLPKKIKGVATDRINIPNDRFNNIVNWYIKTKRRFTEVK